MARYSGSAPSITPVTSNDNWTLDSSTVTTGPTGAIIEVSWGGEVTSSNAMHTVVGRDSTAGTTITTANVQRINFRSPANSMSFGPGNAAWSTQPTLAAGGLFRISWNAHGGVVRWLAAPGEEFILVSALTGSQAISCRNSVGTQVSSYSTIWLED